MLNRIYFKDFIKLQRGFDLPSQSRRLGQYPVVASTSISAFHDEFKVRPPGVTTGRSGSLGEVLYLDQPFWPLNTTLWVKDFKGNYPRYVYYFLKTLELHRYNSGAGVPTLNRNDLDMLEIEIHNYSDQNKIASILSTYDDLIENNLQRIKILEEMAQMMYQEWFVNFRFPGHEKVKMTDSDLGPLPAGWDVTKLGDHLTALESGKRPKGGAKDLAVGIPSVGAENIFGIGKHKYQSEKYVSNEFFEQMRKGIVKDLDVALYKDGAYIGKSSYFRDGFPHDKFCVNEHVFLLRTSRRRLTQNLLYLWLQEPDSVSAIRATNANAAQPGINQKGVNSLSFLAPPSSIVGLFDQLVDPILALIISLAKKNEILRSTRNILLPRLFSGDINKS